MDTDNTGATETSHTIHSESESSPEIKRRKLSKELYSDLTNGLHPLNNEKLYSYLRELSNDDRVLLLDRYKQRGTQTPSGQADNVAVCFFHPGIAARSDKFLKFVEDNPTNKDVPSVELISRFGNTLGSVRLYRGMALTEEELHYVKENQILSSGMRRRDLGEEIIYDMLEPSATIFDTSNQRPNSFKQDFYTRITDGLPSASSISLSTSVYSEVASSVGWHSSGRQSHEDVSPYLFSLKIPKIMTYQEEGIMGDVRGYTTLNIEGKNFDGDGLEVFVPIVILKEWIEDLTEVDTPKAWTR